MFSEILPIEGPGALNELVAELRYWDQSMVNMDLVNIKIKYSMVWPVGFLRFGEGTLATYGPGSRRIAKFHRNLKVLRPES